MRSKAMYWIRSGTLCKVCGNSASVEGFRHLYVALTPDERISPGALQDLESSIKFNRFDNWSQEIENHKILIWNSAISGNNYFTELGKTYSLSFGISFSWNGLSIVMIETYINGRVTRVLGDFSESHYYLPLRYALLFLPQPGVDQ